MTNHKEIDLFNQDAFYGVTFAGLNMENAILKNKIFENCQFIKVNFNEAKLTACKFVDCEFKSCNLSAIQINNTSFNEILFDESKLIGINWTQAKWPLIPLAGPLKFYRSNISHSSFYELSLRGIIIEECKAHDVDFRKSDFSNGCFMSTDFESSLFMRTKLHSATFTDAINYNINPTENDIRKGKYSMPDAIRLLRGFDIEID